MITAIDNKVSKLTLFLGLTAPPPEDERSPERGGASPKQTELVGSVGTSTRLFGGAGVGEPAGGSTVAMASS
jgi:hypothetical protein